MAANQFQGNIKRIAANLQTSMGEAVKSYARAFATEVVTQTPIQDGVARANWQAAVTSKNDAVVPPGIESISGGSHERRRAAIAGVDPVAKMNSVISSAEPGRRIYIFNNIRYMKYIDDGFVLRARIAVRERLSGKIKLKFKG